MPTVLCTDPRPPKVADLLRRLLPGDVSFGIVPNYDDDVFAELAVDAEALLVMKRRVNAHLLSLAPRVRMVQRNGVGLDNLDIAALNAAGVVAAYTPGGNASAVAEHTVMLMLVLLKRFVASADSARRGLWRPLDFVTAGMGDLAGATVGLIGFGHIGVAVAERLKAFGCRVMYTARHRVDPAVEAALGATYVTLPELLAASDIVSMHLPLTEDTYHMIGSREFGLMRQGAFFVNTSRGGLVDEAALRRAIEDNHLAGAALDTIENECDGGNPFPDLDQVVVTPHLGGLSWRGMESLLVRSAANITRFLRGEPLQDLVPGILVRDTNQHSL